VSAKSTGNGSVHELLAEQESTVADLLQVASAAQVGQMWATGDLEFGHKKYIVSGKIGEKESCLYVEEGDEWTGPKTPRDRRFASIQQDKPPVCGKYRKYVSATNAETGEEEWRTVEISQADAYSLIAFRARLTDAGIAKLEALATA